MILGKDAEDLGLVEDKQLLTVKIYVKKCFTRPWTWMDSIQNGLGNGKWMRGYQNFLRCRVHHVINIKTTIHVNSMEKKNP